jgi:hypothetical protein
MITDQMNNLSLRPTASSPQSPDHRPDSAMTKDTDSAVKPSQKKWRKKSVRSNDAASIGEATIINESFEKSNDEIKNDPSKQVDAPSQPNGVLQTTDSDILPDKPKKNSPRKYKKKNRRPIHNKNKQETYNYQDYSTNAEGAAILASLGQGGSAAAAAASYYYHSSEYVPPHAVDSYAYAQYPMYYSYYVPVMDGYYNQWEENAPVMGCEEGVKEEKHKWNVDAPSFEPKKI